MVVIAYNMPKDLLRVFAVSLGKFKFSVLAYVSLWPRALPRGGGKHSSIAPFHQ